MIKLEHVSKSYTAGIPALNDVSLDIEEGEFVFIVGDSGSGKSTLIKLLLKELEPTEGTITINNKKLNKIKRRQIPKFRRNIGVVFQDFRLLKDRNIYDNVAFAQKVIGESNRSIKKNVPSILSMVGLAAKYRSYQGSCPAVSSSVLRSQERLSMSQRFYWRTSRPVTWIIIMHGRS